MYRILAINPGSTSTKIAIFEDDKAVLTQTLRHSAEEIARFAHIIDQLEWRKELILHALSEKDVAVSSLDAVIGRGGLVKPIESGVYEVNDALRHDLTHAEREHASNIGGLIADQIARQAGVKAYIADPVVVDEMQDVARLSGLPETPRISIFHALNQKAIARRHAARTGKRYEEMNLIVAHMGGGISVSAHRKGRVVDTNNALDGDGPFAPERAGTIPAGQLATMCFSGKYTLDQIRKMLAGKGGLVAHLGKNSVQQICEVDIDGGDKHSALVLDAMSYTIAKQIGAMAVVLKGQVDAILLTGGVAYNPPVNDYVEQHCRFIAPVVVYPGEDEMEALALNALSVLKGEMTPKIY